MSGTAIIDGSYRYLLKRDTGGLNPKAPVLFVMLNPSTADAQQDDPTIRRCMDFAWRWGHRQLLVVNLYAYRTPSPEELFTKMQAGVDVVGPRNDAEIGSAAMNAVTVVAAWGVAPVPRANAVADILERLIPGPLMCLGHTKDFHPRHPLYVRRDQQLEPWTGWRK